MCKCTYNRSSLFIINLVKWDEHKIIMILGLSLLFDKDIDVIFLLQFVKYTYSYLILIYMYIYLSFYLLYRIQRKFPNFEQPPNTDQRPLRPPSILNSIWNIILFMPRHLALTMAFGWSRFFAPSCGGLSRASELSSLCKSSLFFLSSLSGLRIKRKHWERDK